jgi:hypothetical protein
MMSSQDYQIRRQRNRHKWKNSHNKWNEAHPTAQHDYQVKKAIELRELIDQGKWIDINTQAGRDLKKKFITCLYRTEFDCENRDCLNCNDFKRQPDNADLFKDLVW